jgi:hypothetical protein
LQTALKMVHQKLTNVTSISVTTTTTTITTTTTTTTTKTITTIAITMNNTCIITTSEMLKTSIELQFRH